MRILDATCGIKGMWYQKHHPLVTFVDKRGDVFLSAHKHQKPRTYRIEPDIVCEWKDVPFPDDYFDVVIFDPPHIIWSNGHKEGTVEREYGHLDAGSWESEIKQGVKRLFEVLKPSGMFTLKWCEVTIPINKIMVTIP